MDRGPPIWTFYGREGCNCCEEAASLLLRLLDGCRITLRMVDLPDPADGPAGVQQLPALRTEAGLIVWEGSFDSRATELAWRCTQGHRPRTRREPEFGFELPMPLVNGLQARGPLE